jgi:hypothetical protein
MGWKLLFVPENFFEIPPCGMVSTAIEALQQLEKKSASKMSCILLALGE